MNGIKFSFLDPTCCQVLDCQVAVVASTVHPGTVVADENGGGGDAYWQIFNITGFCAFHLLEGC